MTLSNFLMILFSIALAGTLYKIEEIVLGLLESVKAKVFL